MSEQIQEQSLLMPKMNDSNPKKLQFKRLKQPSWSRDDNDLAKQRDAEIFAENMNKGASLLFQDSLILFLQLTQVSNNLLVYF